MASGRFVKAHDLQHSSGTLLKDINATGEPCYITEDGKAKAVLMDINRYNALMDLIEETESPHDLHLLAEVTEVSPRRIIRDSRIIRRRR